MASASSESVPVDEINELLTCCMCLETLQEPRSLACFHNAPINVRPAGGEAGQGGGI